MPTFKELLSDLESQHGLPPGLLTAVAQTESSLNPTAVSPKGAQGLFQFMPATAKQYGVDPFNPVSSAIGAAKMFGDLNRKYQGDMPSVLAGYNWGQGNVDRKGLQNAPKETRNYIDKILAAVSPISSAQASEEPYIPTREEFMRMKQSGQIAPQRIPTREEFMMMKRAEQETAQNQQLPPIASPQTAETVPQEDETGVLDILKNVGLGIAARGNQAMAAINPWADQAKIAAEQEWVRQNPGAGVGDVLANMMIQAPINAVMPGAGAAGVAARALGSGLMEGATRPGTLKERVSEAEKGAAGSVLGEGIGKVIKTLNTPFRDLSDATRKKIIGVADELGIPLNAAERTGNKALETMDSVLDSMPTSAGMQAASKDAQKKAWTRAIFAEGGENADIASPEVMGAMKSRLNSIYNDIASRNEINIDEQLLKELNDVRVNQLRRLPTNQKGVVKSYLDDLLNKIPTGQDARISASTYQDMRSMLDKQSRALENSDPITAHALRSIRSAMDKAMNRSVSPEDAAALMQANKEWGIMRTIEKATDPLSGQISPKKFLNEFTKRNKNSMIYGKGDQALSDLARVGKEFIAENVPDSGTAQRSFMMNLLKSPMTMVGAAGGGMAAGGPAGAALGLAGSALLPMGVSKMMWSPNGYLSKGMIDLGQDVMPGLTRENLFDILARGSGVGLAQKVTEKPRKR